jgi:hypothetical protein
MKRNAINSWQDEEVSATSEEEQKGDGTPVNPSTSGFS